MIYKLQNGWTIPLGGDHLEYLQNIPEVSGGTIQPAVKTEKLPEKFHGSQKAARTYAEGYQKGAKPVTKAIDNAGQKIFNTTKNVAMFVPGPTGAITWLGQMGADTANGEYSKVARDLALAATMGAVAKIPNTVINAATNAAGRGINVPLISNKTYSKLRTNYFNNRFREVNHMGPLRHVSISELSPNEFVGQNIPDGTKFYDTKLIDTLTGKSIGELNTVTLLNGDSKVAWVENTINAPRWDGTKLITIYPNKGISRGLYNGILPHTENGLISGWDVLLKPEKTQAVWNHFQFKPLDKGVKLLRQESFVPTLEDKILTITKPELMSSMGNQTNLDSNRYTNIEDILKDFQTGKQHALGYLKSMRKQNIDAHNQQLFKRRLRDKVPIEMELKIEENPYLRASTPMQKPNFHYNDATGSWEGEIQLMDGKWIGKDDNGFFLSDLDGNEYGKTAIIDRIRPYTDQMYLDKKADIDDSAFHEYLHRGRIANANDKVGEEFYKWKTKWLMNPTARPYLMKPEEAAANLLEIGRRAGVHTMEYPGQTKAREIIQKIINEDPVKGNMLNETRWETKPKRVWSALRGEYMGFVPLSGLGLGLMNNDK